MLKRAKFNRVTAIAVAASRLVKLKARGTKTVWLYKLGLAREISAQTVGGKKFAQTFHFLIQIWPLNTTYRPSESRNKSAYTPGYRWCGKTRYPDPVKTYPNENGSKNAPARSSSRVLQIPTVAGSIHNEFAAVDKVSLRATLKKTLNSSRFCCTPLFTAFMYYLFVISPLLIVFLQYYA